MADNIKVPPFCSVKGESILFNQDGEFRFYIPEKMFETKLCEIEGEIVKIFGLIGYAIFDNKDKVTKTYTQFNFPSSFYSKPDEMVIEKELKLTKNSNVKDYRILKYHKGSPIILNYMISEDNENLNAFYKALTYGNIPNEIPYDKLQNYFLDNIKLTGSDYDVGLQVIGLVISSMCRSQDKIEIPFRLSGETNMNKYNMVNIREIPRMNSPYTAFTSEVWDDAVINAVTVKANKASPMEKIMMD